MFALCDVFDALTSARPYKDAWTREAALAELRAQAGRHFDPALVSIFTDLIERGTCTPDPQDPEGAPHGLA